MNNKSKLVDWHDKVLRRIDTRQKLFNKANSGTQLDRHYQQELYTNVKRH
eukprot:COSAG02_NODE_358_length_23882_cov_25.508683_7_plen_50_part_00